MSRLAEQLLHEIATPPNALLSSEDGAFALIRHRFGASEGEMGHPNQLRLALAMGGGGRLLQRTDAARLDAHWHAGQFNIVLPGASGTYASPPVDILGLAIDWTCLTEDPLDLTTLAPLATSLHRDPAVTSILQALWAAAEVELLSDEYLREGAGAIVRRLGQLAGTAPTRPTRTVPPLSDEQLSMLAELIDSAQGSRVHVATMAAAVGMEATRFGRAMQAATGMSPYAFLTHRRMHRARIELGRGRSVTEVAMNAGYMNASKFTAAFRRVHGMPPSSCHGAGCRNLKK